MIRITPKKIILLAITGMLLCALPFWISGYLSFSQLSFSLEPKFNISEIVNLSQNDIQAQAEVYKEGTFIEYKCLYGDSCLNLIDIGRMAESSSKDISEIITVSNRDIPYPNLYITGMTYSIPCLVETGSIAVSYNVYVLPVNGLSRIRMSISGKIIAIERESDNRVRYKLQANNVSLAFNNEQKTNLRYGIGVGGSLAEAYFTFIRNPQTRHFYIVVTTKSWTPPK